MYHRTSACRQEFKRPRLKYHDILSLFCMQLSVDICSVVQKNVFVCFWRFSAEECKHIKAKPFDECGRQAKLRKLSINELY